MPIITCSHPLSPKSAACLGADRQQPLHAPDQSKHCKDQRECIEIMLKIFPGLQATPVVQHAQALTTFVAGACTGKMNRPAINISLSPKLSLSPQGSAPSRSYLGQLACCAVPGSDACSDAAHAQWCQAHRPRVHSQPQGGMKDGAPTKPKKKKEKTDLRLASCAVIGGDGGAQGRPVPQLPRRCLHPYQTLRVCNTHAGEIISSLRLTPPKTQAMHASAVW